MKSIWIGEINARRHTIYHRICFFNECYINVPNPPWHCIGLQSAPYLLHPCSPWFPIIYGGFACIQYQSFQAHAEKTDSVPPGLSRRLFPQSNCFQTDELDYLLNLRRFSIRIEYAYVREQARSVIALSLLQSDQYPLQK